MGYDAYQTLLLQQQRDMMREAARTAAGDPPDTAARRARAMGETPNMTASIAEEPAVAVVPIVVAVALLLGAIFMSGWLWLFAVPAAIWCFSVIADGREQRQNDAARRARR